MFTQIRVTGSYSHPGGTSAQGTVRLRPSTVMRDSSTNQMVVRSDVVAELDAAGDIAVDGQKGVLVYASNDITTEPDNVSYEVHEDIAGAQNAPYRIVVDYLSALGTMDLADVERLPLS